MTGLRFGMIGLLCLAFLFLPVARGSVLLRLIDIPFEHATKYHVWLGHLTMMLFTLHGLFYVIAWTIKGTLVKEVSPHIGFLSGLTHDGFLLAIFPIYTFTHTCISLPYAYFSYADTGSCISEQKTSF